MPHAFGDRVRDVTAESCAVTAPEREPRARNHRLAPGGCSSRWARLNLDYRKSRGREYGSTEPFFKRRTTSVFRPFVVGSRWAASAHLSGLRVHATLRQEPPMAEPTTPLRQQHDRRYADAQYVAVDPSVLSTPVESRPTLLEFRRLNLDPVSLLGACPSSPQEGPARSEVTATSPA